MAAVVYGMEQVTFMTKQLIRFTKTVLRERGDMTLNEIKDAIKQRWPYRTPTTSTLSNVLAKNPDHFMVMECIKKEDASGNGSYDVNIWGLIE